VEENLKRKANKRKDGLLGGVEGRVVEIGDPTKVSRFTGIFGQSTAIVWGKKETKRKDETHETAGRVTNRPIG